MRSGGSIPYGDNFECRRCGACCKDRDVPLALDDILRLSEFLCMDPDCFFSEYCVEMAIDDDTMALPFLKRYGDECQFLDDNICRVHYVKPLACEYLPSTVFRSLEHMRANMPPSCAIQHTRPAYDERLRRIYMASMMITAIYYSKYGTFKFKLARPFIYKIMLFKRSREGIRRLLGNGIAKN